MPFALATFYLVIYFKMDAPPSETESKRQPHNHACCVPAASSSFPYLKKRIQVVEQQSTEMNPIEVAIDEMSRKVSELNQLCNMEEVDMIRLQLKLQGSVSTKVGVPMIPLVSHYLIIVWIGVPVPRLRYHEVTLQSKTPIRAEK